MTSPTGEGPPDLESLETRLGHRFRDRELLASALTHRSFAHEAAPGACGDNEGLEFLGDAVLSFVVADLLYRAFPGLAEGHLSRHAQGFERAPTLAEASRRLEVGAHLRLGRGERRSGGAGNEKILADAYEALVAAIYLDAGLRSARAFVRRTLGGRLRELDADRPDVDHKSTLQELVQARGLGAPDYRVIAEQGPDHGKQFEVAARVAGRTLARGSGTTKRAAQQAAARLALDVLREGEPDAGS